MLFKVILIKSSTVRAPYRPLLNTSHTQGQRLQYINGLWKWGKKVYKPRLIMASVRYLIRDANFLANFIPQ